MELSTLLTGLDSAVKTGTQAYSAVVGVQTEKLKEKSAVQQQTLVAVPQVAQPTAKESASWYKAKWFIPAAIGAGVLVVVLVFFGLRRKK